MKDELKRNLYIKEVSTKYDIYESVLYRELERWVGDRDRAGGTRVGPGQGSRPAGPVSNASAASTVRKESPVAERDILKLLLENQTEMIGFVFSYITVNDITDPNIKRIIQFLLTRFDERGPGNVTEFVEEIEDPALKSIVTDIVMSKYELSRRWETSEMDIEEADPWKIARDAIVALRKRNLQKQIEENQRALKDVSAKGADTQLLLQRHQDLTKQLNDVDSGVMFKTT